MKKTTLLVLTFCLLSFKEMSAQKFRRFSNHTSFNYFFGIADNEHEKKGDMFNISTTFNYKIKPSYGVGIGVGQGNHRVDQEVFGENYNLFSIFLDSRFFFQNKLQGLAIYFNPGYALKIDPAWRKGLMLGLGASYPFSRRKHSNWNLSLNYRYQEVLQYKPDLEPIKLHGIGFGVGFSFH